MIRLLIWFVRVVIIGRPLRLRPPCVRGCFAVIRTARAAVYCQHQLCVSCCADRCRCLRAQIDAASDVRRELAA